MLNYIEAYCRLPVELVYTELGILQNQLVWSNNKSVILGIASLVRRSPDMMNIAFNVSDLATSVSFSGELSLHTVFGSAGMRGKEAFALCPSCDQKVRQLVAARDQWKCGSCQNLQSRKSRMSRKELIAEQIESLEAQISQGRPYGMHRSTFEKRINLLASLREDIGNASMKYNHDYQYTVSHAVVFK